MNLVAGAPKKKRQHFVPKSILRRFSPDGRTISLVVLGSKRRIDGAGLKEQCYRDFFYGRDEGIENAFGVTEGKLGQALGDLSPEHLENLGDEHIQAIRAFVHYQRARTVAAAEELSEFNEALAKNLLEKDSRFANVNFEKVRIRLTNPQYESLLMAVSTFPLVLDLRVKFIVSDRKLGFVLSDHPVVSYNQFVEHNEHLSHLGGVGLAVKGMQMFLPVSPRVCVALYDGGTYEYGGDRSSLCRVGLRDIRLLNTLQVANANACVYFRPDVTPTEELDRLLQERRRYEGWRTPELVEGPLTRRPDGKGEPACRVQGS